MSALDKLKADLKAQAGWDNTPPGCCVQCKQPFTDGNVYSAAGWKETKISGLCEACWDALFLPGEEDEDETL